MNVFSRYLIRGISFSVLPPPQGYAALFTTFNLINELDDVSRAVIAGLGGAGGANDLTAHTGRTFRRLSPYWEDILRLGQLSKDSKLTTIVAAWGCLSPYCTGGAGSRDIVDCFVRRDRWSG
ncbi:hypothetical protein ACLK1T_17545 [Escherichia coli]